MLPDPARIQKYLYIEKTPTWKVRSLYAFGIISWLLIVYGYLGTIGADPFFTFFVFPVITFLTIYHFTSFGLNLFFKQFNLTHHKLKIKEYWIAHNPPSVDIFLPICEENVSVLQNTWKHVKNLSYINKKIYVLDDSKKENDTHKQLAEEFGFVYLERPNKGEMKKAGNLKYGFEHSKGDFIAIFDADFAPHPDFLTETIPYMDTSKIGIVQTPQYFETTENLHKASSIGYNAAFAEEPFYRIIQPTRNRFHGSICCGSNALYRRSALNDIGGPYQIDYSEDAHTGFALTKIGYQVFYIPVILAVGLCPDNYYSFFHQQHRWCMGSMRLMFSKNFWFASISWKIKLCYITGFLFYLHHPLMLLFSFHLFWVLYLYNESIPQGTDVLYYPHILFALIYLTLFPIAKLRLGYFSVIIARTYAYSHAVLAAILRKSVGWVSTNAKHSTVSPAFRQSSFLVSIYLFVYVSLIALGIRTGDIHIFDPRYYSIQFWILYNLVLTVLLYKNLYYTSKLMTGNQHNDTGIKESGNLQMKHLVVSMGLLGFILGISSVLRFYQIGKLPFWNDEIFSVFSAKMDVKNMFTMDPNMSFFHVLANMWIRLIPNASDGILRSLSAILSVLNIPVVFLLGFSIVADKKKAVAVGLLASTMVAFNAYHIQYAQEFRGYSLLILLSTLSSLFLIKAVKSHINSSSLWWVFYIIATVTSLYSHFFAIFITLAHVFSLIILYVHDKKNFPLLETIGSFIAIGLLTIPAFNVATNKGAGQIAWITKPNLESLTRFAIRITGNQGLLLLTLYIVTSFFGLVAGIKIWMGKNPLARFTFLLVASSLVLPLIFSLLISFLRTPIFLDRYLIFVMPYFAIASAIGIVSLASLGRSKVVFKAVSFLSATAVFVSVITLSVQGIESYFTEFQKEDWRGVSQYLTSHCSNPTSLRLYYMIYTQRDATYYNPELKSQISNWDEIVNHEPSVIDVGNVITDSYDQACLIVAHVGGRYAQTQHTIENALRKKFSRMETIQFYGVAVKVYKLGSPISMNSNN